MTGSLRFAFTRDDLLKVARGAALAAAAAVVTYLTTDVLPGLDDSTAVGGAVAAAVSVALNALRKWLTDTRRPAA